MSSSTANQDGPLAGLRLLVLEDAYFTADDLAIVLKRAGAAVEGPYVDIREAEAALRRARFHAAVLEADIRGSPVAAFAGVLSERGIPFVVTAAAPPSRMAAWPRSRVLARPFRYAALIAAICDLRASAVAVDVRAAVPPAAP